MVALATTSAAITGTVSCVPAEFTEVGVRAMPLKATEELDTKFVPFTVRTPPGGKEPTAVLAGASEEIVGFGFCGGLIVKFVAVDVPPPGVGVTTVTCAVPALAMSCAVMDAESSVVPVLYVVARWELFQYTTEVETKPVPATLSVNAEPPAVALDGKRELMTGVSLNGGL
jgi:hypothetical protein